MFENVHHISGFLGLSIELLRKESTYCYSLRRLNDTDGDVKTIICIVYGSKNCGDVQFKDIQ
jgi:hypothetical protein